MNKKFAWLPTRTDSGWVWLDYYFVLKNKTKTQNRRVIEAWLKSETIKAIDASAKARKQARSIVEASRTTNSRRNKKEDNLLDNPVNAAIIYDSFTSSSSSSDYSDSSSSSSASSSCD